MTKLKTLVNRHERTEYNQIRLAGLSSEGAEADRIACMVLAVAYSRFHGRSQSLIQMGCVAACFVGNDIWLASNNVNILPEDIDNALGDTYTNRTVCVVTNGGGHMHAEMQLVEELRGEGHLCKDMYMGVSKPCCEQCKRVLDELGMKYLHYHTDTVVNWETPYYL